ncbi:DUF61 family protein [Candidatus Bathyarchaeota archaeon]|nr:MAG: DUF61 family protein [Candidatus Bathyarchaeota archaeon]
MDRDGFFDVMLQNELRKLNTHLPKNRKTIRELLAEEQPSVSTVGGEKANMKKSEVEALSAGLPDALRDKVRLPLVLLRRRELGPGAFTLLGDPNEEYAVSNILGEYNGTLAEFQRSRQSPTVFYKPQVSELTRRFHSLVVVGFGLSE